MLAYVFWHWPRPDVSVEDYEGQLRLFHSRMKAAPPSGMRQSLAWQVNNAPWLPDMTGYEDWYILHDVCALDFLEAGAVSESREAAHNSVASLAAGGSAGLYAPVDNSRSEGAGAVAGWFAKPAGSTYSAIRENAFAHPGELWIRKMVLGPTPEFCLLGNEAPPIAGTTPIHVKRCPVWDP